MFDGFKANIKKVNSPELEDNLQFGVNRLGEVSQKQLDDGRIKRTAFAKHLGLTYRRVEISTESAQSFQTYNTLFGSFHKASNNDLHNYDTFTKDRFEKVVNSSETWLGLPASEIEIKKLEIGYNIRVGQNANTIIDLIKSFEFGRSRTFSLQSYSNGGKQVLFNRSQVSFKVYAKGCQYKNQFNTPSDLIRFEARFEDPRILKKLGVVFLSDLHKPEVQENLHNQFVEYFSKLVFYKASTGPLTPKADLQREQLENRDFYQGFEGRSNRRREALEKIPKFGCATVEVLKQRILARINSEYFKFRQEDVPAKPQPVEKEAKKTRFNTHSPTKALTTPKNKPLKRLSSKGFSDSSCCPTRART